ncbi:MFS transporter [Ktedonosporobacter rubrisoli]|uniref:MFS transporter n=1 Tax=Ktedonosporobacter rubrisoli TaxID=2509675 RepID=A0A4P6JIZ9_KTERU|nr:MFS transporter [Ktedonosporobacter rubrisoli]QBD74890.1 MFS transporter [Ktedonosporobacter rubrisoli]
MMKQPVGINKLVLAFLVMMAFLDAMGFTIAVPVLPFALQQTVKDTNEVALLIGILSALYAFCQFIAAPTLGILSDHFGRRPILLLCLLGSAFGYLLFGLGGAIWVFVLSRIINGLTGGNLSVLSAYIADMSEKETRASNFGLLNAGTGAGILLGPVIGGFTASLNYQLPFFIAAGISLLALLWGYFLLPKSLDKERAARGPMRLQMLNPLVPLSNVLSLAESRKLLLCTFLYAFPFAIFGTLEVVVIKDSIGWTPEQIGFLMPLVGVIDIVVQGILIKLLLTALGEKRLLILGLSSVGLGYLLFASFVFAPSPLHLILTILLLAGGSGLVEPPLRSLLSETASKHDQGLIQGGGQSIQALAQVAGALAGGALYAHTGHASPFGVGAGMAILSILLVWRTVAASPQKRTSS